MSALETEDGYSLGVGERMAERSGAKPAAPLQPCRVGQDLT